MAYCFMSTEKIKTTGSFINKFNHNFRTKNVPNADKERTHLNKTLIPMKDETYLDAFKRTMKENYHQPRKNAVLGIEVMMSYNANEVDEKFDVDKWCEENIKWLKETFGEENVISAVLHQDEGVTSENSKSGLNAGHIHAMVIPMVDGKLNAKHFLSGRTKLHEMQTQYGEAMKPLGLERGLEGSIAKHERIQKMYSAINKEYEKELPSPEKDETIEAYRERVNEIYKETNLKHLAEIKKKDREIIEAKMIYKDSSVDDRITLQEQAEKIKNREKKLKEEKENFEKEKKAFEELSNENAVAMKKIANLDYIMAGLRNHPNRERAKEIGEGINEAIRYGTGAAEAKSIEEQSEEK